MKKKKKNLNVVIDAESSNFSQWQKVLQGIAAACGKADMTINVCTQNTPMKWADSDFSPVILTGTDAPFLCRTALALEKTGHRVLLAGIHSDQLGIDVSSVAPSRRNETQQMICYLHACGRRRIAFVGFGTRSVNDTVRLQAAKETMEIHDLPFSSRDVWKWEQDPANCLGDFLPMAAAYDAVICPNDVLSISLINRCKSVGIRVPEDLYIASFGNSYIGSIYKPSITTMTMDMYSVGMLAFSAWQFVRTDPTGSAICRITVPGQILVRESTAGERIEGFTRPSPAMPKDSYYHSPSIIPLEVIERCISCLDNLDLRILAELMDGTGYADVCEKLFLSEGALRYRLNKIYGRLGVSGRKEMETLIRANFPANPFRRATTADTEPGTEL